MSIRDWLYRDKWLEGEALAPVEIVIGEPPTVETFEAIVVPMSDNGRKEATKMASVLIYKGRFTFEADAEKPDEAASVLAQLKATGVEISNLTAHRKIARSVKE